MSVGLRFVKSSLPTMMRRQGKFEEKFDGGVN